MKALELDTAAHSGLRGRAHRTYALAWGDRELRLSARVTTVGRSSHADIPLTGALVSRRHARFELTDRGVRVSDEGSRNGVLVNGQRITASRTLRPGDVVLIGDDVFTLLEREEPVTRVRATLSNMTPVPRAPSARAPSSADDDVSVATRRADAFQLLGGVVDKALALGRSSEAEHLIGTHLLATLYEAQNGAAVPAEIARNAARYALKLAAATTKSQWLDFPCRLYLALGGPMPLPIVDELYTLVGKVRGMDLQLLRDYLDSLRDVSGQLSPTERFVLQRLEGLERMARLQSDGPRA